MSVHVSRRTTAGLDMFSVACELILLFLRGLETKVILQTKFVSVQVQNNVRVSSDA